MDSRTTGMDKKAIDATIQRLTHQREEQIPWLTAVSTSIVIAVREPVVSDLTLKQLEKFSEPRRKTQSFLISCNSNNKDIPLSSLAEGPWDSELPLKWYQSIFFT